MKRTLVGALMLALAMAPAAAFAKGDDDRGHGRGRDHKNPFAAIPISGTSSAGAFKGTMDIVGFSSGMDAAGNPTLNAIGILNGMAGSTPVTNQVITWPVSLPGGARSAAVSTQATCDVLNLVLGPLHLDLLGLVVDLNQVVLNIVAQTGAGNLLGNLLCAVTGLLDGLALGPILTTLLNNLTTILAGL